MNAPLRRLAAVVAVLFSTLFVSTTWIQYVDAGSLDHGPGNNRTLYREYGRPRGPIVVVGGQAVAKSSPSNDKYKYQRMYANGPLYAPVTGFYSVVFGESGIESAEGDLLAGTSDRLFYRNLSDLLTGQQPQGATVELTIDPKLQKIAWDALGNQRGAVVAMDPKTGNVLAMVSKPSYDPALLASHDTAAVAKNWTRLLNDTTRPLDNRAIAGRMYPPGSTFKLITAAAAFQAGNYSADSVLPGPASLQLPQSTKRLPNDDGQPCGPGDQSTFTEALARSCNTTFGQLGLELGADALRKQAEAFGFGQDLRIPMRVTPSQFPAQINAPQTALSAIGQFDVRATPLQICMISAAVANGGTLMQPNLVARVRSSNLQVVDTPEPKVFSKPINGYTAEQLRTMMLAVVQHGTGTRAQIDGVDVAGKTGTAQAAEGKPPHAWFTAFASGNNRDIAIAVVVEDGGRQGDEAFGGTVAAPIARQVMEAVVR